MIQFDGYIYVHVSGQRQTGLERQHKTGTMMHMIHVPFVSFAVSENLKASFS